MCKLVTIENSNGTKIKVAEIKAEIIKKIIKTQKRILPGKLKVGTVFIILYVWIPLMQRLMRHSSGLYK